jgi:uncharacterized GH25 family protein
MKSLFAFGLGLSVFAAPVLAHDYWLLPETFTPTLNQAFKVRLYVGDEFKIEEERPFQKDRTPFFQLVSAEEQQDLTQTLTDKQKPISTFTLTKPGTYTLVLDRNASTITLDAKKFNSYLKEDGLLDILALRKAQGTQNKPGRERYSRSIKTMFQVGEPELNIPLEPLKRQIEITPQQNPISLKPGDNFSVLVTFEGQPLANRPVTLLNQTKAKLRQEKATDNNGQVTFQVPTAGVWMVRLVYMRPCAVSCQKIDWESFWSSLTFAIPLGKTP